MSKHTEHIAFFIRQKLQLPALYVRAAALLLLALLLLRHRTAAVAGVVSGIHTCLGTLIPSLFPFILLACLCTNSRAAQVLFRPLSPVMRHVFRLPACAAPAVLLGLTAGYPTGAKITANLYAAGKLTREQAARLLCFCTAPGYAFAAAYTGSLLLRSDRIGLNLFFACALAPLLLGLTLSRFAEKPEKSLKSPESAPGGIVSAVQDGIKATVSLCGFVLVFSMLLAVLHDAGIFQFLCGFLSRFGLHCAAFRRIADDGSGDHRRSHTVHILAPAGLFFSVRARLFRRLHPLADLLLFPQSGAAAVENEICSRTLFKRTAFRCILFAAFLFSPGKHLGCRGNLAPQHRAHGGQRGIILGAHRAVCVLSSHVYSPQRKNTVENLWWKFHRENATMRTTLRAT